MIDDAAVFRAADVLRRGGVVAFPTETVYGLGADARLDAAARRIFAIKGRPADHPLIVHAASAAELFGMAIEVPKVAYQLAEAFWPGPLTLVLRAGPTVSRVVTGGFDTVAVRVPHHPVALALLEALGGPVAAPSANRFTHVSPTTAAHVVAELGSDVDFVLDGGPCQVGLESTIVDLCHGQPGILRPGGLPRERLEALLGHPLRVHGNSSTVRVPGQHAVHYAPRAQVRLVQPAQVSAEAHQAVASGLRVGVLTMGIGVSGLFPAGVRIFALADSDSGGAQHLFATLREADALRLDLVLAVAPPSVGLGLAVNDRLQRAAGPRNEGPSFVRLNGKT